jgi:diamine N-acetyltransferase
MTLIIEFREVGAGNWRAYADLEVAAEQRDFVSPVARYLCLCHYGGVWQPLAVYAGDEVVGFVMWAVDPGDQSGWIGGLVIDQARQRRGYGRATVEALTRRLLETGGCSSCALSYSPGNSVARDLYLALGFVETGEIEDDELVARLSPSGR